MNQMQGILGNPGVGFFSLLLIGIIAGWIAEKVTESDHGILTNMLIGICGAFVGSKLAEVLEIQVFGFWRTLASAAPFPSFSMPRFSPSSAYRLRSLHLSRRQTLIGLGARSWSSWHFGRWAS